jgi:hypothetical protein
MTLYDSIGMMLYGTSLNSSLSHNMEIIGQETLLLTRESTPRLAKYETEIGTTQKTTFGMLANAGQLCLSVNATNTYNMPFNYMV